MPGCVMSLPTNSGGKKYTVEQAELIRRLRNSGMTKEQVLMAFDSFDLIDQCIGNIVISSLAQKTVINSSSVAVLAENLISRQAVIPNLQGANTNLTSNLSTSLLSSIKIPHITSSLLSPIIPVTIATQLTSMNQTPIAAISASAATPITSVVAITGNALQLQLSVANSQQSSGASQQLQQQVQVMQVLQQLGLLGVAASNSITPASITKGLTATSLTSSLPLNLSQAVSQSLLSSQPHHHQQSQSTQMLSPTLPQQQQSQQLALQLQQLPQHLQAQIQQTHSTHYSATQNSPALVSLPPVFQQLIQQQSQQPQNTIVQQLQQLVALQQLQQVKQIYDSQSSQALITSLIAATTQHQPTSSPATTALLPSQLVQLQQLAQLPLQQHILHQQLQHHPQQTTVSSTSPTSTLTSSKITQQVPNIQQQEQLLQQIIKQLHSNTAAAEKQSPTQQPPVSVATPSTSGSQVVQSNPPSEEPLSASSAENDDTKQGFAGGRRSFNFKNGVMKEDVDEDAAFLNQDEILCCEEIKEFTVINNIKQHQIAALTGISQAYISRYLKGEYMGMSDKCCRTIKKWYITYRNNPAAIEENANRQAQLAASRLVDQCEIGANSMEMDQPESYVLPPPTPVTTVPSTTSSSGLTYPRRERFVFRPNHLELLEKCFMEENYPSLKRREEIAKVCNIATEKLTGRALSDKEKVGVQTISNWFANKRKDLKRLFKEADGMEAASPFLTRSRGRPPLTQSDPHFYSTISSLFNHSPSLKIQRLEQQLLNGLEVGNGNEIMIGQSKENLLLGEAEAAALQLSVETAAVNQAIYSLTGQLPIIPLPPNKKGTPELSQQTAEFLSNLVANFKNSINGESNKGKTDHPTQSNGSCEMEVVGDDCASEVQDIVSDPQMEGIISEDCSEVVLSCETFEDEIIFSNGRQDGDNIFDDIMSGEVAMNCELGSSE